MTKPKQVKPLVAILMGSTSDMEQMSRASKKLEELGIDHEVVVTSAHRSPAQTSEYVSTAKRRGIKVLIVGAGRAAHLAGAAAANTTIPVLGVPLESGALKGFDALLSTVQMPGGIPVATFAIGKAGAKNAGLFAAAILARADEGLRERLAKWREAQAAAIPDTPY